MTITYRTYRRGDLSRLTALTEIAMPRDVISEERFVENILLDVNFNPAGLIVAEHETDGPIGFVYATQAEVGIPSQPEDGYFTVGCVHPDYRRGGVGSRLLTHATEHLRTRGATRVTVSGYPQAYFTPGLDVDTYPEGAAFLASQGFKRLYTAAAMHLDLDAYAMPATVRELTSQRTEEGYSFAVATWEDLPETISFAASRLAADWGQVLRESCLRYGRGVRRVVIARGPNGAVVGFATYGAYGETLDRFGPFGVDETQRGTGLGRILLHQTLTRMRADGAHGAWFLWTGEDSPAGHLYRSAGFDVVREFDIMRADLTSIEP